MSKINLGILFGGASSEYEVSLMSVTSILENIDYDKYNIVKIGITKQGCMLHYTGELVNIKSGEWYRDEKYCEPCHISTSSDFRGVVTASEKIGLDVIFPVLHGKNGEDGTMQGLLTIANIPFVGCNTTSSAICMDKEYTHIILNGVVPMAKYVATTEYEFSRNSADIINRCEQELLYPMFVKPANTGSSVGVSKASNKADLIAAIRIAFTHDKKIVIEEMLTGREVECAVLGNNNPKAAMPGDIEPCNEWYDYDAKYLANKSTMNIPAKIQESQIALVQKYAIDVFAKLGCAGLARVDFFVNETTVILNEINTIPGFTSISMYAKMWEASGLLYSPLIDQLIMLALGKEE